MRTVSLEELLEAGCHFGHQVTRQNPKARDFVFETRDNIHIIDLAKTKEGLEEAISFVKQQAEKEASLLIVGTKRQAKGVIEAEIKRAYLETGEKDNLFYITSRWIGGVLTNFSEISKNLKKFKDLSARLEDEEEKSKYTKKEIGLWQKERAKLKNLYEGIVEMKKTPDTLFIIDTHKEDLAVREAQRTGTPTVGIVDTNADPAIVDYPIPANDDAVGSIKLIIAYIVDAWIEGKNHLHKEQKEEEPKKETEKTENKVTDSEKKVTKKKTKAKKE